MTAVGVTYSREPAAGKWWWVLLVTGILWILIGLFVLQAHYESATTIGYLVGFWLLFGGVAELVEAGVVNGWKWLHIVLGVLFIIGGIAALTSPFQTFTVLALVGRLLLDLEGHLRFRDCAGRTARNRSLVDVARRRHHRDRTGHLGDGLPRSLGGTSHHLGRYRRGHPRVSRRSSPCSTCTLHQRRWRHEGAHLYRQWLRLPVSGFALTSCSTQARAERKGKEAGRPDLQGEGRQQCRMKRSVTSTVRTTSSTISLGSRAATSARTSVTSIEI